MKEKKGKIFNSEEVQAIIAGKKTMFREVVKTQPVYRENRFFYRDCGYPFGLYNLFLKKILQDNTYKIGQEIFVKEAFVDFRHNNSDIFYKSDFEINNLVKIADLKWSSARFMKQEQSRITLKIKSVKVERLIDIEDCLKEGFSTDANYNPLRYSVKKKTALQKFIKNWNSTHTKKEHKWEANPFVFVYEFEIINN